MSGEVDWLRVKTPLVSFHVLKDKSALYLIDGGFVGGIPLLKRALTKQGWNELPITGILLTHGHLDHILNVAELVEETGAWIAGPTLDSEFYSGSPKYSGLSRITGLLEAAGRRLFEFRAFEVDRRLNDGDRIDVWGGLELVHLPGHTAGHSGYYSPSRRLLFSGDLFASFGRFSHLPPAIFNADERMIRSSLQKALSLSLNGVIPNHCDHDDALAHLRELRTLAGKYNLDAR